MYTLTIEPGRAMDTLTDQTGRHNGTGSKSESFRGRGLWSLETISVDNNYVVYKKRASLFSPMFTITVPRLSIRSVEASDTLSGTLLKITTLSNNNIFSRSFAKSDIKKIIALLRG